MRVELLAAEVLLHQRLVGLDDLVEQLLTVFVGEVEHLSRNRARLRLLAFVRARVGTHVEHVDDPLELLLGADREMDGNAAGRELFLDLGQRPVEVGALAVEHVDEEDARQPEIVGEVLDAGGAHLESHDGVHDHEDALDDPQRTSRLTLEARVARHVDEVDLAVLPARVRSVSEIDIFRFCSSSSQSPTVVPASIAPSRLISSVWKSRASTRDVLPVPRCPTTATLRIFPGSIAAIGRRVPLEMSG